MSKIYSVEEIDEITSGLHSYLSNEDNILRIVSNLNRNEKLEDLLELVECMNLIKPTSSYSTYKNGTIVVIGQSEVSKDKLLAVAKSLGIDKSRFEMHLDYDDAKRFQYGKMQWAPKYSLVIVGPQGHSTTEKADFSSAIARMEQEEGFPPVLRSGMNNDLVNISKSAFKEKLQFAIDAGYIEKNFI